MKKKTVIVVSSVVFAIILGLVLAYRMYLIGHDVSGFYELKTTDSIIRYMTFLPEIAIITTIVAVFAKKRLGLTFTVISCFLILSSIVSELLVKYVRIASGGVVPDNCVPLLNIPVLIICIILFAIKFHIYTLPSELKVKLKIVNLC